MSLFYFQGKYFQEDGTPVTTASFEPDQEVLTYCFSEFTAEEICSMGFPRFKKVFGAWEMRRLNGLGHQQPMTLQALIDDGRQQFETLQRSTRRVQTLREMRKSKFVLAQMERRGIEISMTKVREAKETIRQHYLQEPWAKGELDALDDLAMQATGKGKIYPQWLHEETGSGRITIKGRLQSLKKRTVVRQVIQAPSFKVNLGTEDKPRIAPTRGTLIMVDYSQCHMQIFANFMGYGSAFNLLTAGTDVSYRECSWTSGLRLA
jgi:hypothetical protein